MNAILNTFKEINAVIQNMIPIGWQRTADLWFSFPRRQPSIISFLRIIYYDKTKTVRLQNTAKTIFLFFISIQKQPIKKIETN